MGEKVGEGGVGARGEGVERGGGGQGKREKTKQIIRNNGQPHAARKKSYLQRMLSSS